MHVTHVFAGIAVSDFTAACDWYARAFDSPPDTFPKEGKAMWHAAPSASIYLTADATRAGHALLTLAVKNLEDQRVDLCRRGIAVDEDAELNGLQTLTVTDPDGNRIKLFEDPGSAEDDD